MSKTRVLILGGGMSALTAGIDLLDDGGHERFDVTLVCMEHRLGGKASSWRLPPASGEPSRYMEIGFHGVFGYYVRLQQLLARAGRPVTDARWFRSNAGVHLMYEAGSARSVNRLDLPAGPMDLGALVNSGLFSYRGMSWPEKIATGAWMLATAARFASKDVDPALDEEAFTDYCIRTGLPAAITEKSWFRYVLDLAFNYPHKGSAFVGMAGFKKLMGPEESTVYYFNGPMSEVMVSPLAELFTRLGGKIELCTKATAIELDPTTHRIESVTTQLMANPRPIPDVVDRVDVTPIGSHYPLADDPYPPPGEPEPPATAPKRVRSLGTDFDEVVWTLPIDSTRALLSTTSDPLRHVHAYEELANIWSLHTVASISARVWSPEKLVPSTYETVVMGTPQPAATVIDYANGVSELQQGSFGSVLEFEGQEGLHGHLSDDAILRMLLQGLRDLPFARAEHVDIDAIASQTRGYRSSFRRNTANHLRYVLMEPGHWKYRPAQDESPYENLVFGGDWMRGEQETASMEAAVRTGRFAANWLRRKAGLSDVE